MASFLHATAKRLKLPAFEEHYAKETAMDSDDFLDGKHDGFIGIQPDSTNEKREFLWRIICGFMWLIWVLWGFNVVLMWSIICNQ